MDNGRKRLMAFSSRPVYYYVPNFVDMIQFLQIIRNNSKGLGGVS